MKSLFLLLLLAVMALGAWLLLGDPPDMVREPERRQLQIEPERFQMLGDADLAHLRNSAAAGGAAPGAPAALAHADAPKPDAPRADTARTDPGSTPMPSPSYVEIGDFASESAARKARARLAEAGVEEHVSTSTVDRTTRLRISAVDAALEGRIQRVLKDFPRQRLVHCAEAAPAR